MKKILVLISVFSLLSTGAFAFDLKGALKDQTKEIGKGVGNSVEGKIDASIKKLEDNLNGQIAEYKQKIDAEEKKIRDVIKETEDSINKIKEIKNKAAGYIRMVKIVLALLSSGILVLIFVMWRIYRNVITLRKVIKNVANYDDINSRLKKVEAQLAQLKK